MLSTRLTAKNILSCLLILTAELAQAQGFPDKTIRIVTTEPGSTSDFLARLLAQGISGGLGRQVIVENRGGGLLASDAVLRAAPDGTNIILNGSSLWLSPLMRENAPYDAVKDFSPITLAASAPSVLVVHPSLPVRTVSELIALAKSKPGELNYGSGSTGAPSHLAVELFKAQTGIDMVHVAYRGNPLAMIDVIGGHVPVFFDFVLTGAPHVRSGAVRALATTGAQRSSILPDLPTVIEAGIPGFEASTWFGVYAPAGTPKDMVAGMSDEIAAVLASPNVKKRLAELGVEPMQGGPAALGELTRSDLAKWGPVIQKAGLKLE